MTVKATIKKIDGKDYDFDGEHVKITVEEKKTREEKVLDESGKDTGETKTVQYTENEQVLWNFPMKLTKQILTKVTKADILTHIKVLAAINESTRDLAEIERSKAKPSLDTTIATKLA